MTRVGVIADTHGLLRPEAVRALEGCERILHAGDVGRPEILAALAELAPVTAVRGNVDRGELARLPRTEALELAGVAILMHHGHEELGLDPVAGGFGVVVQGHSHRPELARRDGVLWLNPGSAGPRRFRLPVTLALLRLERGRAEAELVELVPPAAPAGA